MNEFVFLLFITVVGHVDLWKDTKLENASSYEIERQQGKVQDLLFIICLSKKSGGLNEINLYIIVKILTYDISGYT